jgi:hypothetical protein
MSTTKNTLVVLGAALALAGCDNPCDPDAPGTICTVAGSEEAGFFGNGGLATEAELYQPMDVTVGSDGTLYVVDWNNHQIRAVDDEGVIRTIAGTGTLGDGPPGPALDADFNHPTSLAFGPDGQLYIAAWHNSRIRRVNLASGIMEDVCGTGARAYNGDGGPALMAQLDLPASIQFEDDGSLLIVDQANQVIRRVTGIGTDTTTIDRVAGQCIVVGGCPDGGTPVACAGSQRMACDPANCIDPVTMALKPCARAYAGDDGPALEARFAMPFGQSADPAGRIALDDAGNIYLADTQNHRIRRIGTDGMVTTIAGNGDIGNGMPGTQVPGGYSGDGGPAVDAQLNNPVDVAFGDDGTLYIADTFNSCIRAIDPSGTISTVAGQCGVRGFEGDGAPAGEALLDWPYGIEVSDGKLYIADTMNNRIRVVPL